MDATPCPIPSDTIVGRWFRLNRHGDRVGETVVITLASWRAIPDSRRPAGKVDSTSSVVMVDCPIGWRPGD